jgi:hypothetical protein
MAVTYTGELSTDLDRVRFHLGDTGYHAGSFILPGDENFDDDELLGLITIEGNWHRAVAAGFEMAAAAWSRHVTFTAGGMSSSQSDIANQYRQSAQEWRNKYGYGAGGGSGSVSVTRADGYSNDLDNVTAEQT